MSSSVRFSIVVASLLAFSPGAVPCILEDWTFENLRDEADAIVIAEPTSTTNTGVIAPIEGRKFTNANGGQTQVFGMAVRTNFKVLTIFKGKVGKEFTLTLYRELPAKTSDGKLVPDICPYPYRVFDPSAHEHYLIFLESVTGGGFTLLEGQSNSFATVVKLSDGL